MSLQTRRDSKELAKKNIEKGASATAKRMEYYRVRPFDLETVKSGKKKRMPQMLKIAEEKKRRNQDKELRIESLSHKVILNGLSSP